MITILVIIAIILAILVGVIIFVVYKANQVKNKFQDAAVDGIKQLIVEQTPKVAKTVSKLKSKTIILQ